MYLNPETMTQAHRSRIDRWLKANGAGKHIALEPVIVRGKVAEFYEVRSFAIRSYREGSWPILTRRRLRIRIPLNKIE